MTVRYAEERDLAQVNVLRKELNDLHVAGKPEVFKAGFSRELEDYLFEIWEDPMKRVVVAEEAGTVLGFAVLQEIRRPENPFMVERHFLDVDELGVAGAHRRQGIGTALLAFIREEAKARGFDRVELNMWEFNRETLAFYEAAGYVTYRRYLELKL